MSNGLKTALRGLVIVVIGIIFTAVSYSLASSGSSSSGRYLIAGGAFVIGGWYIISGLYKHFTNKA